MWTSDSLVTSDRLFTGVMCLESATYVHQLTNYPPSPVLLYTEATNVEFKGRIQFVYTPKIIYEDTEVITGKLRVTNVERTICDLINYKSNEEYIYDSIESYMDSGKPVSKLLEYAAKYNCLDKMNFYINTLDDYLADAF